MRQATTKELNYLANHPRVAPALGLSDDEEIDLSSFYDREGNIAFWCPIGGMMFPYIEDGVYDSHFLFIPGSSAVDIKRYAAAMINEMFTKQGARVIKGYPPRVNRAVRVIGVALGYRKIPNADVVDAQGRACETYEVRKEKWVIS